MALTRGRKTSRQASTQVPFRRVEVRAVSFARDNLDTDQILPARFMKRLTRRGLGQFLFNDLRSGDCPDAAAENAASVGMAGDTVLLTGRNFGCGSSREHAVWALCDANIRAVIACSFGEIFMSNAVNNGLLAATVTPHVWQTLADSLAFGDVNWVVDLGARTIRPGEAAALPFSIDESSRSRLIEGTDTIDRTLCHVSKIESYEHARAG